MKIQFNLGYKNDIINKNAQVVTRDGRKVEILKWDANSDDYPIIGTVTTKNDEEPYSWTFNGNVHSSGGENDADLFILIKDPKFHVNDIIKYNGNKYLITEINDDEYKVKVILNADDDFDDHYCTALGFAAEDRMELVVEPELTEFEKRLKTIVNTYAQRTGEPSCIEFMSNEGAKNHAKFLLDAIGYKNSPRFKVGDKIYSTHNPLIKYEILEVGVPNELGTLDYRAKNISDDKTYRGIERLMEISKVDEWGELISPQWTEEDESYYKSVLWHVSNSISNGKETNVKSDLTVWLEKLKNRLSN